MMWALLLFLGVVAAVHWWEYRTSVQEYTFAQPASLDNNRGLREVLAEKTPVTLEIGALPWRPEVAEKSGWTAETAEGLSQSVSAWLQESPRVALTNQAQLAEQMDLRTGLADMDGGRAWWWIPGIHDASVDILPAGGVVGLSWVSAERQWVGCSAGSPLTVWLVHSRYRRYLPSVLVDPWSLTVTEAPWIGRVQYIEVRIRPGWCIGLPAHWGWAIKTEEPAESWWWTAAQHSALSWTMSNMANTGPSHTESLTTESEE
jgi:hypothetical protein